MTASQIAPYQLVMLIGGVVLFLVAVGLLLFFVVKKRSTKPALVLLLFAIVMIGFPAIKSFKGLGFEMEIAVNLVQKKTTELEKNPDDPTIKEELRADLDKLEANVTTNTASAEVAETIARGHEALGNSERAIKWASTALAKAPNSQTARVVLDRAKVTRLLPPDLSPPPTPAARSNLASAATQLSAHSSLTPEARFTLGKAQLALGQTNAARTNFEQAVRANSNLFINPTLLRQLNIRTIRSSPQ